MTQSTFLYQVANKLLMLLQGYSKTIRLLLVMFLTLTASTAWGAKITTYSSIVTGKTYYIGATTGGTDYYLLVNGASTSTSIAGTAVTTKANATAFVFTGSGTSWKIKFADYANYLGLKSSKDNGKVQVVSSAATFTASNQSGKLRLSIGSYSIQKNNSGTQFGSYGNTQTDIWLEEVSGSDEPTTTYTIKWHTAVGTTTDVTLNEGAAITKPATDPTMTGYTFMGWTEDCEVATDGAGFTPITNFGTATEDKDFYAVFAKATTTGGGGGSTIELFSEDFSSITSGNSTGTNGSSSAWNHNENFFSVTNAYQAGGAVKIGTSKNVGALVTKQLTAAVGETLTISFKVKGWSSVEGSIQVSGNNSEFAQPAAITYTSTISGSFETKTVSVVLTKANPYIKIATTAKRAFIDDIVITKTTSGGGGSTTYSGYITTCAGSDTPETFTVTFNANGRGTAPNAQTITSGEKASEPTAPKETGYTFGGWYENQQCTGNQFDFNTAITADITLYAKWTIAEYTIKATLEHCASDKEIPTTYTYTGSAANLSYTITPEDGYGLPKIITFSGCEYTWDQSTGILTLTGVIKSDVTFTIAAKKIHTITWKVDGEEYTTGDPSTTVLNNERVSKLPTNPTLNCSGKTFVGWSDQEVTDGNKPSVLFTSAGTSPQILKNTTFHAVFATLTGSGNGQNTTDILTHEINGKNSGNTNYTAFTEKKYNSDAIYAGNTANSHGGVQLRGSDGSGIVTTTSGGYAKSITIDWNSNTTDGRILDIYGKNEAYTAASDLYDANTRGTKLGSIVKGTSTVLTIDGDYRYIGLRSASNAIYINSISIVWSSSAAPTYTGYTTTCTFTAPALDAPDGLAVEDLTCSSVTLSWEKVKNATGYEVVRTLGSNTTYNTTENSITIDNLDGGKENSWKVRAIGDGINYNNSEYTIGEKFTTLFSVKYYVDEVLWNGCDNGCVANGSDFTICEETPTKANNTFTGWATSACGEVAYQAGETINNIAANVTLHAVWDAVTYIVNWSVNGEDNIVSYTYGQALQLPEIDVTPCDGMDHVGWTDNMGYVHETNILFTETTDMTVTSDKTYYAVFATPTSSGGGETTLDFSEQGYSNGEAVTSLTSDGVTVEFDKGSGSTAPAYYDSGSAVRVYANGTFTVSSGNTISKIVITFGTSDKTNEITTNKGTYSEGTWTGSENSVIFTIGGTKDHRRIQSITVTSAGGGASYYTGHTTTCSGSQQLATPTNLQATDITYNGATLTWGAVAGANSYKVVINGQEPTFVNTNKYITHALKPQTAYTWTVQAIGNGTTFINSEISAEATFTTAAAVTITWIAGATKTTNTITYGQSIGEALGELPTPATPDGCKGKTFMGWTTTRKINSDGTNIEYLDAETVPTENTTYYAVFAQGDIAGAANITDELTYTINGKESGNTYYAFTDKEYTSDARYAGSSANGYSAIQLRSSESSSGIVTTTSGGSIKSITVEWESHTTAGRTLDIYGKNAAYNDASDLYNQSKQGTLLGSIVYGTSTSLIIDGNYQYIGLRSKSGAMYLTSITIVWTSGNVTYTDYSTSCGDFLVTYYGFNTGGYTTICGDNPGEISVPQFDTYTIPTCTPTEDPQGLNRTFAGTWVDDKGNSYKPGDSFEVTDDITLYAQWKLETTGDVELSADQEDLATTNIVVTGGHTLTIPKGETITINSLTLKGGLLVEDDRVSGYAMPSVVIPEGATLVRKNTTINLDLTVNNQSYYPFAVPFEVANTAANVNYIDSTLKAYANAHNGYGNFYDIKEYNGVLRAENGEDKANNWVHVGRSNNEKLTPGKGYIISAVPAAGDDTVTIRITMNVDNAWLANGEQESITVKETTTTRNAVEVTAYTGAAAEEHQRHAGWNFVANPYLSMFAGNNVANDVEYIKGSINIQNKYTYEDTEVTYVTVPAYNFAYYEQFKLSATKLNPAYSFFVQVGKSGTMTFETTGRQQAPASIAARNAEERPVKMDVDITLSDTHSSDLTGIIISDRYNDTYEIGRDLEKLFGSAYNLSVYTLMADNTPLAYQALAIRSSMQVIPVGYRAPAQGEYTFRLNEATSSIDLLNEQYEQLVLVDYQTGALTNLLNSDYTFYSERTQSDTRFAIYAVPRQNASTDLPNAIGQDKEAQKIIHNGHLYILRNGNVYNGAGQIVK